jgi:hypothetical protein
MSEQKRQGSIAKKGGKHRQKKKRPRFDEAGP